jgi:hypothetical protein
MGGNIMSEEYEVYAIRYSTMANRYRRDNFITPGDIHDAPNANRLFHLGNSQCKQDDCCGNGVRPGARSVAKK